MLENKIVLTGIKPTGEPHIGNYIGALKPAIELSKRGRGYVFIADLHSLNTESDKVTIKQHTQEMASALLALGLDLEKSILFRQSDIPEVYQLSVLLNNVTPKGLMNRAHAYKAAVEKNIAKKQDVDNKINMGLYTYPILMAADILLYSSNIVPVGQDQKQHVEFARDIAGSFNHLYGDILSLPEPYIKDSIVLPGLDGRKMSKSYGNIIPIFASEQELKKKIMKIITDSKLPKDSKKPEESTIFQIYTYFASLEEIEKLRNDFICGGLGYGTAKNILFEAINKVLTPFREKYIYLMNNQNEVEEILANGAQKARARAKPLLEKVSQSMLGRSIIY